MLYLCIFLSWFRRDDFFHWRKQYYRFNNRFVSYKHAAFHFTRCKLMDWSGVYYCDVFISCLDSHSDSTHSLQSIHWWTSDAMLHFSTSDLHLKWAEGEYILAHFWVNNSFNRFRNLISLCTPTGCCSHCSVAWSWTYCQWSLLLMLAEIASWLNIATKSCPTFVSLVLCFSHSTTENMLLLQFHRDFNVYCRH